MTPGWERWFVSNLPLFGLIVVCAHLVMSCGQTLMHCWFGHHRLGGRFFHNHINFHHTYYARGHLTSAVYRGTDGNNTPFFLIPTILVGGALFFVLPLNLFVVMALASGASFSRMSLSTRSITSRDRVWNTSRGSDTSGSFTSPTICMRAATSL